MLQFDGIGVGECSPVDLVCGPRFRKAIFHSECQNKTHSAGITALKPARVLSTAPVSTKKAPTATSPGNRLSAAISSLGNMHGPNCKSQHATLWAGVGKLFLQELHIANPCDNVQRCAQSLKGFGHGQCGVYIMGLYLNYEYGWLIGKLLQHGRVEIHEQLQEALLVVGSEGGIFYPDWFCHPAPPGLLRR